LDWITEHKIPVGAVAADIFDWLQDHGDWFFDWHSILWVLQTPPEPVVIIAFMAIAWLLQRSWKVCALVGAGFLFIINQGYWEETTESLTLVLSACTVCMVVGVPIGIIAARRPTLYRVLRPILDLRYGTRAHRYCCICAARTDTPDSPGYQLHTATAG